MGTVFGALIGFLGTSIATRKQADLQERAARRQVYADHLGTVIDMQKFHQVARQLNGEHHHLFRVALDYSVEQMNADDQDTKDEIGKAVAHYQQLRDRAVDRIEEHTPTFDEVHNRLVASGHRLKIIGHPQVHDAAMEVYRWLGHMVHVGQSDEEFDAVTDGFNEALQIFSLLARADTKAPSEVSWTTALKRAQPRLAALRHPPESTTVQDRERDDRADDVQGMPPR